MIKVLTSDVAGARADELEQHRRALTSHCHRMLGSQPAADDAVQETMFRAWRSLDSFEGRSALRTWLYRIATNVCLDVVRAPEWRVAAMDLGPAMVDPTGGARTPARARVRLLPDVDLRPDHGDPAELMSSRESIRLAFVAALRYLPARQRAVVILCEVLSWRARDVAEVLGTTAPAVNSALQRARATLAAVTVDADVAATLDEDEQERLAGYLDAFERYDMVRLVWLLAEEVRGERAVMRGVAIAS